LLPALFEPHSLICPANAAIIVHHRRGCGHRIVAFRFLFVPQFVR
jgi:hypothetical protein